MSNRKTDELPAWLARTRERFERWRRARVGRPPIPDPLWASAVRLARRYGIYRTARALGVDYYSLKGRVEGEAGPPQCRSSKGSAARKNLPPTKSTCDKESAENAAPAFLELTAAGSGGECLVELENAAGGRMRIHLKGVNPPDLVALSRTFWGTES